MLTVEVERRPASQVHRSCATEPPAGAELIEGDAVLVDRGAGAVVGIHAVVDSRRLASLARGFGAMRWDADPKGSGAIRRGPAGEARLSGIVSPLRTFGTAAPQVLRRRYGCSPSLFDLEHPALCSDLAGFARAAVDLLIQHAPRVLRDQEQSCADLLPCWRFGGTLWTSGIINRSSALPYHRDSGNIAGSWSAMLALKRDCEGGYLHLDEYDVWLAVPHGSITIFDGQAIQHGVSPFRLTSRAGYRYTVVLYSKAGVRRCVEAADEPHRAARLATIAADRQAARP